MYHCLVNVGCLLHVLLYCQERLFLNLVVKMETVLVRFATGQVDGVVVR